MRASAPLRYINDDAGVSNADALASYIASPEGLAAGANYVDIGVTGLNLNIVTRIDAGTTQALLPVEFVSTAQPWVSIAANVITVQPGTYDFVLNGDILLIGTPSVATGAYDVAGRVDLVDNATGLIGFGRIQVAGMTVSTSAFGQIGAYVYDIEVGRVLAAATALRLRQEVFVGTEYNIATGAATGANTHTGDCAISEIDNPDNISGAAGVNVRPTRLRIIKRA